MRNVSKISGTVLNIGIGLCECMLKILSLETRLAWHWMQIEW